MKDIAVLEALVLICMEISFSKFCIHIRILT